MTASKKLLAGIIVFVMLDLSILLINYWIAHQVSNDAVAINLAGRQRMLTQRISKTLLELKLERSSIDAGATIRELLTAAHTFDQTLQAFDHGGITTGGDGMPVVLNAVKKGPARDMVFQAQQLWLPTRQLMLPYLTTQAAIPDTVLDQAQQQMQRCNVQLLELMNSLTLSLQKHSVIRASALRVLQTIVFILALVNFLVIVRKFHLLAEEAHQAKEYFSQLALRDHLTGLVNRREFEHNLKREISAISRRANDKFAVVMVDLDGFKPINDKLGHNAGDIVLKTVADRLASHARITDTVARIGGDEFVLICTTLRDVDNAEKFCERLLESINEPIPSVHGMMQVGASIGVAFYPNKHRSEHQLMHAVDQAMYDAKRSGRNCYVFNLEH